jgi:hypothetical protein
MPVPINLANVDDEDFAQAMDAAEAAHERFRSLSDNQQALASAFLSLVALGVSASAARALLAGLR